MADYVSKYTGSEVDGILDEAIELPDATSYDNGKFLKYSSDHGIKWDNPIDTTDANNGDFLKYSNNSGLIWDSIDLKKIAPEGDADHTLLMMTNACGAYDWVSPADIIDEALPQRNTSYPYDKGKVLGVNTDNELEWLEVIPDYSDSYDQGKVLGINTDNELEWVELIPAHDSSAVGSLDVGKVLTVDQCGELGWESLIPDYDKSYSSNDTGKVLMVLNNGELDWNYIEFIPRYTNFHDGLILGIDNGALRWMSPSDAQTLYDQFVPSTR